MNGNHGVYKIAVNRSMLFSTPSYVATSMTGRIPVFFIIFITGAKSMVPSPTVAWVSFFPSLS